MNHLKHKTRCLHTKLSFRRCDLFATKPGQAVERLTRRLTEIFPNSKLLRQIWSFTLPF